MGYDNEKALQQAILKDMQSTLDRTVIKMVEKLKDFIQENLYDVYDPLWYERTMQVLNLWMAQPSVITGNSVTSTISPDYNTLKTNRSKNQHIVTGETLINMLISGYGTQTQPYNMPRDFWSPYIEWVNQNFDRIFQQEFGKANATTFINL